MRRLLLCSVFSLFSVPALAQTAPADLITQDAVKAHVQFLADDLLEGRDTGARGHEIAARYVASRFTAKGRFAELMARLPVKLITHPQPGLFGAAAAFAKEHLS